MTAYLRWLGVAEAELSLWRGAGALAGIAATFAYPRLHRAAGTGTLPAIIKGLSMPGYGTYAGWCAPTRILIQATLDAFMFVR